MTTETLHAPAPSAAPSTASRARFWDRMARAYAATPVADMVGYELTLTRTRSLLSRSHRVLEIGCGTGTTALHLGPSCGHLVATDLSPEMIAIAREKLAAAPRPGLEFQVADAPGPGEACYDVVLAFNVLHLFPDLDGALGSTLSALAPGGLFVSKTPCLADMNPLLSRVVLPVMRLLGKAPPVLRFGVADLQAALVRQGLDIIAVEHHGTRRGDLRPFIVARKRGPADG